MRLDIQAEDKAGEIGGQARPEHAELLGLIGEFGFYRKNSKSLEKISDRGVQCSLFSVK